MQKFPFPEIVQIQTSTFCNADCIFCPYVESSKVNPKGFMDEKLFTKIMLECSKNKPRIINLFLMNEPLADNRLGNWIKIAKEHNPHSTIDISTNASLLSETKASELITSGLGSMTISFHSTSKEDYEVVMKGLDFEKTLANVKSFLEVNNRIIRVVISMRPVKEFAYDYQEFKAFCERKGAIFHKGLLTNRAGLVKDYETLVEKSFPAGPFCKRPFGYIGITFDGKVLACCADWKKEKIMGDINNNSILEVWNNENYEELRSNFRSDNFNIPLCKDCRINAKLKEKVYI